jgi:hypothetical protein
MARTMRGTTALALVVACAAASGCGSETTTVTGTVTFQRAPLKNGTVALYCADKQILHGVIDTAGRFSIGKVPAGAVRVTVQTHRKVPFGLWTASPPPKLMQGDSPIRPTVSPNEPAPTVIPYRYAHPEESGLTFVAGASQFQFDIDLVP